jgi:F0F1-type ATP synthase delta subunit
MKHRASKAFIDELLRMSVGKDSLPSDERIVAILRVLGEMYQGNVLRNILNKYLSGLENLIARLTLKIEHSGVLPDASINAIRSHIEGLFNRKLLLKVRENASLIAGIRLTVNDFIIENSIVAMLDAYKNSLKAQAQSLSLSPS